MEQLEQKVEEIKIGFTIESNYSFNRGFYGDSIANNFLEKNNADLKEKFGDLDKIMENLEKFDELSFRDKIGLIFYILDSPGVVLGLDLKPFIPKSCIDLMTQTHIINNFSYKIFKRHNISFDDILNLKDDVQIKMLTSIVITDLFSHNAEIAGKVLLGDEEAIKMFDKMKLISKVIDDNETLDLDIICNKVLELTNHTDSDKN